ncbi:hypothetical protein [Thermoactinomyces sp. DSM 45892]|uniref:hypothetical protein n=1 Tax=Thermoactinomyces sp. DSM 45892 TaxID=1882753 RepID=UPI00089A5270|nr:hypothetical protein [Thermoactinomyces sp. DSM 45892]SDX94540.1 hypothetical protein SAMN05444416_10172 [Thermoactinomyces sp. DSM 45892]
MNRDRSYIEIFKDVEYFHPDNGCGYYYCEISKKIKQDSSKWLVYTDSKVQRLNKSELEAFHLPVRIEQWSLSEDKKHLVYSRLENMEGFETEPTRDRTLYLATYLLYLSRVTYFSTNDYKDLLNNQPIEEK